jgi:coenzyme F420-dependent glucose-6-phosphate dehydrogenase
MTFYHLKPKTQIPIYYSAVGEKAAFQAGKYADRLMSVGTLDRIRDVVFRRFEEGARSVGRDPDKMEKAVAASFATGPKDKIVARARKLIAGAGIDSNYNEMDPRKIEASAKNLTDKEILDTMYIFQRGDEVIDVLEAYKKIGTNQVIISDLSVDPEKAMSVYATKVIPHFKGR